MARVGLYVDVWCLTKSQAAGDLLPQSVTPASSFSKKKFFFPPLFPVPDKVQDATMEASLSFCLRLLSTAVTQI